MNLNTIKVSFLVNNNWRFKQVKDNWITIPGIELLRSQQTKKLDFIFMGQYISAIG